LLNHSFYNAFTVSSEMLASRSWPPPRSGQTVKDRAAVADESAVNVPGRQARNPAPSEPLLTSVPKVARDAWFEQTLPL